MSTFVVIDANRLFSELIAANHRLRSAFASCPDTRFVCSKYVLIGLFKHKERIAYASGLPESELLALLHSILERIEFIVTLTLDLDAELWTSDRVLEVGLRK